jgi:L-ascorbate metabolism protein UlaG (beta-lactamase superfamily)
MTKKINTDKLESLGKVDVLFIPVGGKPNYLELEEAIALVSEIEPRIVIPIGYECDSDPKSSPLDIFLKEIGLKPALTDKKIILKSKDLPQEEMQLMVLEKNI